MRKNWILRLHSIIIELMRCALRLISAKATLIAKKKEDYYDKPYEETV